MNTKDNLAWRLNWYRQSELEGALLLGRMAGLAEDGELCRRLTRHAAEEAEHARLWADAIHRCGMPHIRIHRSYQSFFLSHSGPPASLLEVLCFTQIFERRVHQRFQDELNEADQPEPVREALARMIDDERDHLGWVAGWLRGRPGAAACLKRFRIIDQQVFDEIQPYEHRINELPGLGRVGG
ncbi:MAG: ferritin-like domain-containing protein [Verrucomicrobiales bacterium]|nr:ferritin-like domain-containing protein [Verrucomicrobiales bacterium]